MGRAGKEGGGGGREERPHPQQVESYGASEQKMLHNFCTSPPTRHKYVFQVEMSG